MFHQGPADALPPHVGNDEIAGIGDVVGPAGKVGLYEIRTAKPASNLRYHHRGAGSEPVVVELGTTYWEPMRKPFARPEDLRVGAEQWVAVFIGGIAKFQVTKATDAGCCGRR